MQHDDKKSVAKLQKQQVAKRTPTQKEVPLFAHLPQYEKDTGLSAAAVAKGSIHPAVLRLGLQMAEGIISGSNARVVGMLRAFQQVISDFEPF
jgi:translation initiation factor eIF-2B subunit delta